MNVLTTVLQQYLSSCEKTQEAHENDKWRLRLHLMPPTGFMNDPNGLCWFKGLWHVFFQYAPSSTEFIYESCIPCIHKPGYAALDLLGHSADS